MAKQKQLDTIISLVRDGGWHLPRTLKERFRLLTGKDIDVSSVKARLRDLRKDPYRCRVQKRPHFRGSRELEYRVTGLAAGVAAATPRRRRPSGLEAFDSSLRGWVRERLEKGDRAAIEQGGPSIQRVAAAIEAEAKDKAGPERRLTSDEVSPLLPPGEHLPARPRSSRLDPTVDMSRSGLPRGDLD